MTDELIGGTTLTLKIDGPLGHEPGLENSRATAHQLKTAFCVHPCADLAFLQSNADSGADGEGPAGGGARTGTGSGSETGAGTGATPKSTPEST